MGLLFDKYIPQEGLNNIFSDMQNCEIEIRPSDEGYNAPYFYLKKRAGLITKTGWKTGYQPRSGELEKLGFDNMVKETKSVLAPTGFMVKAKKDAIFYKIKKDPLSNIQTVAVLDGDSDLIIEKNFDGKDELIINTELDAGKEYYIVGYYSENGAYFPSYQKGVKFPVNKSEVYDIVAGITSGEGGDVTTSRESASTGSTSGTRGVVYKAERDVMITEVKKFTGSGATKMRFSIYDSKTKTWSSPEMVSYDGDTAKMSKGYILSKGDKIWIANNNNGSSFTYVNFGEDYPTNSNNDLVPMGGLRDGTPYDSDKPDANGYYKQRYEIKAVKYAKALEKSGDTVFNFTELSISEKDETTIKQNFWQTIGEIVDAKMFDDKMWMYTDKGYVYNFNGTDLNIVPAIKQNISYLVEGKATKLKDDAGEYILRVGSEFGVKEKSVITGVSLRLRSVGKLSPSVFVRCNICAAGNPKKVLATSKNAVEYTEIAKDYKLIDFVFAGIELDPLEKYLFYLEAYYTDVDGYIEIDGSENSTYEGYSSKTYNSKDDKWEVMDGMIGFHISTTKALYIDRENFDDCMLVVDYLGGGIYPLEGTEYTIKSYDATKGIVTLNETTLDETFIGKYAYIKSGSDAKYQERAVSDTTKNTFTSPAGFSIDPVAGDKVEFYKTMEQQIWIPQIRKGKDKKDKEFMFTFDRSGNVYWRYFPNKRNLVMWDNRVLQLTDDRQALLASSNIDYEIPILNSVSFGNSRAKNMAAYGGYLIVFFDTKIGLVKKETVNAESGEFNYTYQDLLDVGLYSRESFIIQGGNLYIYADDKRLYSVDLTTVSLGEIIGKLEDQGATLINYFDKFDGGTVKMYYQSGILYLVYRSPEGWSEVFKYYDTFKAWLQDKYDYSGNFMNFLYTLKQDKYIPSGDKIYKIGGLNDDGKPIEQRIKMYGPIEGMHDLFTFVMCKLRLGLDVEGIGGYVETVVGGFRPYTKRWNIDELEIIKNINTYIDKDGTMGSDYMGNELYGGEGKPTMKELLKMFSEILDVSFKVGRKGTYFTIELVNTTKRQLKVGAIVPYYNTDNPLAHYNKGVMK